MADEDAHTAYFPEIVVETLADPIVTACFAPFFT
jgi:hypothetical protein